MRLETKNVQIFRYKKKLNILYTFTFLASDQIDRFLRPTERVSVGTLREPLSSCEAATICAQRIHASIDLYRLVLFTNEQLERRRRRQRRRGRCDHAVGRSANRIGCSRARTRCIRRHIFTSWHQRPRVLNAQLDLVGVVRRAATSAITVHSWIRH